MSNSYSSNLITQKLLDGVVTKLTEVTAPMNAFTVKFSADDFKPKAICQLKLVTAGSTTLTNPSNYEQGDSTVANIAITPNVYSKPFHVGQDELNSGLRTGDVISRNLAEFAADLNDVALSQVTAVNFPASPVTVTGANFGFSSLQTLFGQLQKSNVKNVILEGTYFSKLLNQPTYYQEIPNTSTSVAVKAFGWDFVGLQSRWTAADAKTYGFACNPQAIAIACGLPVFPKAAGGVIDRKEIVLPNGLTVAMHAWISLATRTTWMSFDCVLGASVADSTAGVLIQAP
jgi:hypothetical protein